MAILYKRGNILKEPVDAYVNPVNCVGVMGRGLAFQFKVLYPENFKEYVAACRMGELCVGKMFIGNSGKRNFPKYIVNFPTKQHWVNKSKIEYIELGLIDLVCVVKDLKIYSIAIPPIGCGLGGLAWNNVRALIDDFSKEVPETQVVIFEP